MSGENHSPSVSPTGEAAPAPSLQAKVAFLQRPDSYADRPARVETIETHMSFLFLTDRLVYKLKRPIRYDFLDFSTVELRRRHCEAEVVLNRRLAGEVYLGVVPLTLESGGRLALEGTGMVVDWLVKMRRLPAERMLDQAIRHDRVDLNEVRRFAGKLAEFYRAAPPVPIDAATYLARFDGDLRENLRELSRPEFHLPQDVVAGVIAAQRRLLEAAPQLLADRAVGHRILEAHGDLRPEHVLLGPQPLVIDCLEFNRDFRLLDPADELGFLAMECEQLGSSVVGETMFKVYGEVTGDWPPAPLVAFYKCNRACLRAKLSIWHLREPLPREPERWPRQTRRYLEMAATYATELA